MTCRRDSLLTPKNGGDLAVRKQTPQSARDAAKPHSTEYCRTQALPRREEPPPVSLHHLWFLWLLRRAPLWVYAAQLKIRGTPMLFRGIAAIMLVATTVGCSQFGVTGSDDLGLAERFRPETLPVSFDPKQAPTNAADARIVRNQIISGWLLRSDYLCGNYQLNLSRTIRDSRLAMDVVATVLSGLATILAPVATKTALAGAATMTLGVGGAVQSDLFMQQAGEVVGTAIQAVRTRARNELEKKFQADYDSYTLEQGLVDVQRYDRETCNLNVGLNEIRASLNLGGSAASQLNGPIVPLSPFGAGIAGATPPPAAMATTIVPPMTTNLPGGGVAVIPGKVISTPVTPPVVTPPPPPIALVPSPPPPPVAAPSGRRTPTPSGHGTRPPLTRPSPQAALSAAISRITTLVKDPTQRASVLDKCGLPKEAMAAAALADSAKVGIAKCLDSQVHIVPPPPVTEQMFLDSAVIKLRALPQGKQDELTQKCLGVAGFAPT